MNGVPLHWRRQAFTGATQTYLAPSGLTILDMIRRVPEKELPPGFWLFGVVCLNGECVPRELWARMRVKVDRDFDVVITLHVPLHHGGGGSGGSSKNPLATVAAIALLVVATLITGGAAAGLIPGFFAAGNLSATVLAAGVGVIGSLAISALSPPPSQQLATNNGSSTDPSTAQTTTPASVDGNVLSRGDGIPRVLGTAKIFPPLACEPLIELIGDDEYVEALYVLAGPHRLTNIKIGNAAVNLLSDQLPIANLTDVEYQISEALPSSAPIDLITRQAHTDQPQLALSRPIVNTSSPQQCLDQISPANDCPFWHLMATRNAPDEFWIQLAFQEGITDYSAPTTKMAIPVRMQFRPLGSSIWTNAPEVHFCSKTGLPLQKAIRLHWSSTPFNTPQAPTDEGPYLAYKLVPGQTTVSPQTGGWQADSYFAITSGSDVYSSATFGAHALKNIALNKDGVDLYLDPSIFPRGIYEINLIAGGAYDVGNFSQNAAYTYAGTVYDLFGYYFFGATAQFFRSRAQVHDKVTVGRLSSVWNETPLPLAGGNQSFAAIAVRAKNRRIESLSTVASGYVKDWNGSDWGTYAATSNPAPHFYDVLTGPLNADPIPPALIDSDGLVAWRTACDSLGYQVNGIVQGSSNDDVRLLIAACGYARPFQSEKWGVMRDYDRSTVTPVQIFSPRTLSAFRWEKAFPKLPDGFRVIFQNAALDYQQDELVIYRPGVTSGDRLEEMQYAGITDATKAAVRANYDLAQLTARATFYYGTASAEALVCQRGDLVGVQHDVIAHWAGFSRIQSVTRDGSNNVTSITLDSSVPAPGSARFFQQPPTFFTPQTFFTGQNAGASIRSIDGSGTLFTGQINTDTSSDEVTSLTFTTPIADPTNRIAAGCHVVTGILGQEYKRLIVFDMKPSKDLTVDITFVDEAPQLFAIDGMDGATPLTAMDGTSLLFPN